MFIFFVIFSDARDSVQLFLSWESVNQVKNSNYGNYMRRIHDELNRGNKNLIWLLLFLFFFFHLRTQGYAPL